MEYDITVWGQTLRLYVLRGGGVATAAAGGLPAGARIVCQKNLPTVIYLK